MGYEKSVQMKIIRTKHIIRFYDGSRVRDIMEDLKQVPFEAKLIDFHSTDENHHLMVFELEEQDKG